MPGTIAAARTLIKVNVTGFIGQSNRKVPWFTVNTFYLTVCNQVDVDMPADLDQFGRNYSHGTVIGREGLVKPGHKPADGWRRFNQVNIIIRIGEIQ